MEQPAGKESNRNLEDARDCVGRAIDLLISEDVFGAVLQLQKARSILDDYHVSPPREAQREKHDWGVIDPYTAQCRLCGKNRSLGIEERTLTVPNL
jgi:hypothetical protein